jgi:valyl-tRNA synthetase
MSKTKGNVIDPLVIMGKYGTDAVRIALLISAAAGNDIALKEDRMEAGRTFANKLWNASRLLFMNMETSGITSWTPPATLPAAETTEDAWIFHRFEQATAIVNRALELHRYHEAAQTLWDFVWREFCDWYLEVKKLRFREGSGVDAHWQATLTVYEASLRLLHPFMPFVTEELWQRLIHGPGIETGQPKSISLAHYPKPLEAAGADDRVQRFELLRQVVTAARELRADNKLEPKAILDATLYLHGGVFALEDLAAIGVLAKINVTQQSGSIAEHRGLIRSGPEFDLQIHAAPPAAQNGAGGSESYARIAKEIENLERVIANSERQLQDPTFLGKAPEKVVAGLRAKLVDYQDQLAKNKKLLEGLES